MVYELVGREEGGEALLVVPLGGAVQRGALVVVCRLWRQERE